VYRVTLMFLSLDDCAVFYSNVWRVVLFRRTQLFPEPSSAAVQERGWNCLPQYLQAFGKLKWLLYDKLPGNEPILLLKGVKQMKCSAL